MPTLIRILCRHFERTQFSLSLLPNNQIGTFSSSRFLTVKFRWYFLKISLLCRDLPGRANSFSTPPVSFQCISRLVGGARSEQEFRLHSSRGIYSGQPENCSPPLCRTSILFLGLLLLVSSNSSVSF